MKNSYDAVINDVADISRGAKGWNAGRFLLTTWYEAIVVTMAEIG